MLQIGVALQRFQRDPLCFHCSWRRKRKICIPRLSAIAIHAWLLARACTRARTNARTHACAHALNARTPARARARSRARAHTHTAGLHHLQSRPPRLRAPRFVPDAHSRCRHRLIPTRPRLLREHNTRKRAERPRNHLCATGRVPRMLRSQPVRRGRRRVHAVSDATARAPM